MAAEGNEGRVYLVGAGPGDPGLLTARALELIAGADVILYDRLVGPGALDGARAEAELLFVGKEGGGEAVPQERTEELMLDRARAGLRLVRLKGGDPFVFGRGGEEARGLREAGIAFEIVPGITAGVAAAAYAGDPVTHRGLAGAVALVTGHTREDGAGPEPTIDWPALAVFPGTLVFYMGVRQLGVIAAFADRGRPRPRRGGGRRAGGDPARAALGPGNPQDDRRDRKPARPIRPPSVTDRRSSCGARRAARLAGRAAALRHRRWRSPERGARPSLLAARLRALGAHRDRGADDPHRAPGGAAAGPVTLRADLRDEPQRCHPDVRAPGGRRSAGSTRARSTARKIAAIGPGTVRALEAHGIRADIVPERSVAESLLEALADVQVSRPRCPCGRGP